MDSMPPATITSMSPARMACDASMTAFSPEPHTLFTVVAPTVLGMPALMAAWRAGACPTPACRTFPIRTSSTSSGLIPARLTASRITTAPSSCAGIEESPPMNSPLAVRVALTMYASRSAMQSLRFPQEFPCDDELLDLGRALADFHELGVAEISLHRMVRHVPRPPVDLDGGVRGLHRNRGGQELRHRRLPREGQPTVFQPGCLVDQQPRRLDPGRHVREQELDRLEFRDRLSELPALARVLDRGVEGGLCDPDRHRADGDPPPIQGLHELLEALPFLAVLLEEVFLGQLHVIEKKLDRVAGAMSQLLLARPRAESGGPLLDDEGGDPLHPDARRRDGGEDGRAADGSVRDVDLPSVDCVVAPVEHGAGLGAARVGARLGLREPERRKLLPGAERGKILPLLLRGPEVVDGRGPQRDVRRERDPRGSARARDLLDGDHVGERVQPLAAVFLGEDHSEETQLAHLLDVVPREFVRLVVAGRLGSDLLVREFMKHVAEARLLFGQLVKVVRPRLGHRLHPGPRAGQTGISQTSSTRSSASVDFRISSTVTPGARSMSLSPCGVTSITASSVMMRSTTFFPVSGSVHFSSILEVPSFAVCSIVTTTRRAPATRSIAPPMPLTILPGTIQLARFPS